MKIATILLFCISLATGIDVSAQKPDIHSYIILTVEQSWMWSFEGKKNYYWICEADSITTENTVFYPLVLEIYARTKVENCCKGVDIDPFVGLETDTLFNPGDEFLKELTRVDKLIKTGRKKIQQISKNWATPKNKEVLTFYLTPIKGRFCHSGYAETGQRHTGYKGPIFIPYSTFEANDGFWESAKIKLIGHQDFTLFKFDSVRF